MPYPKANLQPAPEHMNSYSTQEQDEPKTVITRHSANMYLTLNSKDRFLTALPSFTYDSDGNVFSTNPGTTSFQPWNTFKLQRPQNLMESFATRIVVSEIRFPMFIPNINSLNNTIWIQTDYGGGGPTAVFKVTVPTGFYTPTEFKTALQNAMTNAVVIIGGTPYPMTSPPVVKYIGNVFNLSVNPTNVVPFVVLFYKPDILINVPNIATYLNTPSMALTMGFDYAQVMGTNQVLTVKGISGNVTELLYTQYIDIVSDKLNYYTTNRDGSSDAVASRQLLARLYLSDEVSMYNGYASLYAPFLIHRQFKNPKEVMFDKKATVDWLDISVYDQYGQLVPLPSAPNAIPGAIDRPPSIGAYPDFQITLLATEN